jgi:hypothetical protein
VSRGTRTFPCRDCGQHIQFVPTEATGRLLPIDPFPQDGGNVLLRKGATGGIVARVLNRLEATQQARAHPLYKAHQATCPARQPQPAGHPAEKLDIVVTDELAERRRRREGGVR